MKNFFEEFAVPIFGVLLLLVAGVSIFFAAKEHSDWESWCVAEGGHVDQDTKVATTYVDGKVGTATSTTYYCLSDDGRILDVQ